MIIHLNEFYCRLICANYLFEGAIWIFTYFREKMFVFVASTNILI